MRGPGHTGAADVYTGMLLPVPAWHPRTSGPARDQLLEELRIVFRLRVSEAPATLMGGESTE